MDELLNTLNDLEIQARTAVEAALVTSDPFLLEEIQKLSFARRWAKVALFQKVRKLTAMISTVRPDQFYYIGSFGGASFLDYLINKYDGPNNPRAEAARHGDNKLELVNVYYRSTNTQNIEKILLDRFLTVTAST